MQQSSKSDGSPVYASKLSGFGDRSGNLAPSPSLGIHYPATPIDECHFHKNNEIPPTQADPLARIVDPASLDKVENWSDCQLTKKGNKHKKKGDGKPKRPLSAYNMFFHHESKILLDKLPVRPQGKPKRSHGKVGFVQMPRFMGGKWRSLGKEAKAVFEEMAAKDKKRYEREKQEFIQKERSRTTDDNTEFSFWFPP